MFINELVRGGGRSGILYNATTVTQRFRKWTLDWSMFRKRLSSFRNSASIRVKTLLFALSVTMPMSITVQVSEKGPVSKRVFTSTKKKNQTKKQTNLHCLFILYTMDVLYSIPSKNWIHMRTQCLYLHAFEFPKPRLQKTNITTACLISLPACPVARK